jgi:diguanylate cyclase (GGDEF)-like protein
MKSEEQDESKGGLFFRIMVQLTIPLILLATLLTALEVNNKFGSLNKLHLVQGQWIFNSLKDKVVQQLTKIETDEELLKFDKKLKSQTAFYNLNEVGIFDYLKRAPVNPDDNWTVFDLEQVERSILENKESNKPYWVVINKDTRQLNAYVPVIQPGKTILIVKASIALSDFREAVIQSKNYLIMMMVLIVFAGIVIGINLSRSIVKPILQLNQASSEIIRGKLGKQVNIHTGDELEVLANTFNHMSSALEEMQKKAIDANPLTGLSGNQGIFKELKKRIFERQKFVLFHIDLDRFKVFNDHYGLAKGDEALKKTAEVLQSCVVEKGAPDDYVGHQGGDDFVIITRPNRAEELAKTICRRFDKEVVASLYSPEDVARGYTTHMDRRFYTETGQERMVDFPLMAISLAGISTAKRDIADYFQCMNIAAGIKKEAKKEVKSSYIIQETF